MGKAVGNASGLLRGPFAFSVPGVGKAMGNAPDRTCASGRTRNFHSPWLGSGDLGANRGGVKGLEGLVHLMDVRARRSQHFGRDVGLRRSG